MAVARYWRLVGLEAHAGGDLELSELHLYDGAGRADVPGMLSASAAPIAGAVSDLSDGNSATLCRFAVGDVAAGGFKLEWDLGAGNEKDCAGVRIGASTDPNLFLARCFLQSSTDGYAWNTTASWDRFAWPGAGTMTVAPQVGDSSYNNVTLLMHCDSATDSSATPKTITASGGAAFTGAGLFGAGLRIAGAGVVLVDHHADLSLGSSDFTVEIAYYPTSVSAVAILLNKANGTNTPYPLQLYHTAGGGLIARSYNASGLQDWQISAGTLVANQWNYIAVERSGSTIRLYLGGAVVGTTTFSGTAADNSNAVSIGAYSTAAYPINGVLDEIRVTKGVARYMGAYSPQASPFPNTTGGGGVVLVAPPVRTPVHVSTTGASAPVPSPDMRTFGPLVGRDVEFGGRASITGTVGIKGTGGAPDTMTKSRVRLLRQRDGLLAREVWSDPVTGAFAFHGLDPAQQFIALAEDNAGVFAPVAADRRTPEVPA